MKREVVCVMCGKSFDTEYPNKKYCSLVCKDAAIRKKRLVWKLNNPGYDTEYARKRREKECQE